MRWAKTDPRLDNDRFQKLTHTWTRATPARDAFSRRQLLIEIDVLVAMGYSRPKARRWTRWRTSRTRMLSYV